MSAHFRFGTGGHSASLFDAPCLNVWGLELGEVPAEFFSAECVFEVREATLRVRGAKMLFIDFSQKSLIALAAGETPRPLSELSPAAAARRRAPPAAAPAPAARPAARAAAAPAAAAAAPSLRGAAAVPPTPRPFRPAPVPRAPADDDDDLLHLTPPSAVRSSAALPTPPEEPGKDGDA